MSQALVLAAIWIALSAAPLLLRSGAFAILVCAMFRFIIFEILSYPLVGRGGIQLTLLCALVSETVMVLAPPADILLPLAFAGLALVQPLGATAWDRPIPRLGFAQSALTAFILLMLIVLLRFYKGRPQEGRRAAGAHREAEAHRARSHRYEHRPAGEDREPGGQAPRDGAQPHIAGAARHHRLHSHEHTRDAEGRAAILRKDPEQAGRFIAKTMEQSERGLRDTRAAIGSIRDRSAREATIAEVVTRLAKPSRTRISAYRRT